MHDGNPVGYYKAREQQERDLAAKAINPAAAHIHRTLALRYSELISEALGGSAGQQGDPRSVATPQPEA